MPDWNLIGGGQKFEDIGADTSVSEGTELTSSGSTHTKGSYTELIASTSRGYQGLYVMLGGGVNGRREMFDIAVGAGGSEQIVLADLWLRLQNDGSLQQFYVPLTVKRSSRISARMQSTNASDLTRIKLIGVGGTFVGHPGIQVVDTVGADTATTDGTAVVSGASNTKGSWTQIVASTTRRSRWILVAWGVGGTQQLMDIGIGASSSEVLLIPNLVNRASGDQQAFYSMPCDIPAGTRISARTAAALATNTSNVVIYLFA